MNANSKFTVCRIVNVNIPVKINVITKSLDFFGYSHFLWLVPCQTAKINALFD